MQRREFLKGAAYTGGVAAVTAASARRVYGANSRVNVALIGCGSRGVSVAESMQAVAGVEYVAVCDVYQAQALKAKNSWAKRPSFSQISGGCWK